MTDRPLAPADLLALVGSRITHDLANPVGAIANGVELLALTGAAPGPELALITESVEAARARIKAFRIAFGAARPGQAVGPEEIRGAAAGLVGPRLALDWAAPAPVARAEAKLAALAVMCLDAALPQGGRIAVAQGAEGRWRLEATGPRLAADPALWGSLAAPGAPAGLAPAQVQFALIGPAAAAAGRRLAVTLGAASIAIAF